MCIYIYTYSQTWIQDQFTPAPGSLFAPAEAADVVNYSDFIDSVIRHDSACLDNCIINFIKFL